jgi:hypothetical protein
VGRAVFYVAIGFNSIDKFQGILNLPKENLTTEEVNKNLLATDNQGRRSFMWQLGSLV